MCATCRRTCLCSILSFFVRFPRFVNDVPGLRILWAEVRGKVCSSSRHTHPQSHRCSPGCSLFSKTGRWHSVDQPPFSCATGGTPVLPGKNVTCFLHNVKRLGENSCCIEPAMCPLTSKYQLSCSHPRGQASIPQKHLRTE